MISGSNPVTFLVLARKPVYQAKMIRDARVLRAGFVPRELNPEEKVEQLLDEMFTRIEVRDPKEIWKFNLLQPLNAYREIFAPVGYRGS